MNTRKPVVQVNKRTLHHDLQRSVKTLGASSLLSEYTSDRITVVSAMQTDPDNLISTIWKETGPLAIDTKCQCQMGKFEIRSMYSCAQCKSLRRVVDFESDIYSPFILKCNNSIPPISMKIERWEIDNPSLSWNSSAAARAQQYINLYPELKQCGSEGVTSDLRCIVGDNFTINALITWKLQEYFDSLALPHITPLYTAFICNDSVYTLKRDTNKDINFCSVEVVNSVIGQILVILKELSKVNFSHGSPTLHSLAFNKKAVSYRYENTIIQGPVTVELNNLNHSSATFNNVHYYSQGIENSLNLDVGFFVPKICAEFFQEDLEINNTNTTNLSVKDVFLKMRAVETCVTGLPLCYKLTGDNKKIYNSLRHIGFPLFVGSFDFYSFMLSLMMVKDFYNTVISHPKLTKLWRAMWINNDAAIVENMLNTTCDPIDIMKEVRLRCDVVQRIWNLYVQP